MPVRLLLRRHNSSMEDGASISNAHRVNWGLGGASGADAQAQQLVTLMSRFRLRTDGAAALA
jgi:hypothetical protein